VGRRQNEEIERSPFRWKFTILILAKTHLVQIFNPTVEKKTQPPAQIRRNGPAERFHFIVFQGLELVVLLPCVRQQILA
jgi:hypothetical protein